MIRQVPWAQNTLAPDRAWPFSKGDGVLVAVIDSGVDTDHPQLSAPGKVLQGFDYIRNKPGADFDCISHGTAVASVIAGDPEPGIGFRGVAPDAQILPLRVSDLDAGAGDTGTAVKPDVFAKAIEHAADCGAKVINLSVVMYADVPAVRYAVQYAQSEGALIVAAVGNQHQQQGQDQTQSQGPDPTPYPAAYPGVIGVGAITINGTRLDASQVGPYVDLVAPGGGVLAATRQHGYVFWDGTSFATPFVSGTAALVRSEFPQLSAAQVAQRLLATADPAPGGASSPAYGYGIVDPYRAVTEGLSGANPAVRPARLRTPTPDAAAARRRPTTPC
jgi:type VII secretion-associated serine protease mycosin